MKQNVIDVLVTDACQVLDIYVPSIIENKEMRLLIAKDKIIWFWILIPLGLNIFRVNFQEDLIFFRRIWFLNVHLF